MPRVFEMLQERIVTSFPAIEGFLAEETGNIVGVLWVWVEEEACGRKLRGVSDWSASAGK